MTGDYEGYRIVRHSRSTISGAGVQEGKTKNGRTRTVSMNEDLFSLLRGFCYRNMYPVLKIHAANSASTVATF